MRVERYYFNRRPRDVEIRMSLDEFRETVEWLETICPQDGATRDWRAELDRIDPPETAA